MVKSSSLLTTVLIITSLIGFNGAIALAEKPATLVNRATAKSCSPIGRILTSTDRRWQAGTLLCQGDRLYIPPTAQIGVFCFLNRQILPPQSGTILAKCVSQPRTSIRPCSTATRRFCPKTKGPLDLASTPELLSPLGRILLQGRPRLSWRQVKDASSYSVSVYGKGVNFVQTVGDTTLSYPQSQPAMAWGSAYKIEVTALKGDVPFSAAQTTVNMLPESEAREIALAVERIRQLKLPPDEVAYLDLDRLYMNRELLGETIATLAERVKAGSQSSSVLRTLGDRYLEAGLVIEAGEQYKKAIDLAQKAEDAQELSKAQAGWEKVLSYR
ncbi:tetratricopeptide repeat protein [Merismopedia glauca]|uniref:Tetratricopeptide repeat protein n=1 Tax=Merismopedia glauca CCAP 1448/3 TaxID=1296344 RepID=A0A2T1C9N5_9CYAN|nr:hypothetical protein [Merismopedia glauca]PSB04954.1 hypothetical protein C7B64_01645 [Merismopedia glauca CCAP 1448/3]